MHLTSKGKISKKEIIETAILEFSNGSYTEISLNQFCKNNAISKGHFYHYFDSKQALYLECVKETYDRLTTYLEDKSHEISDYEQGLNQYLDARYEFGKEYPNHLKFLIHSQFNVMEPLRASIRELKQTMVDFNMKYFRNVLEHAELQDGLTLDDVLEFYLVVNDALDAHFHESGNVEVDAYYKKIERVINMMMFGTIKRGK